jgi:serine/threonine protein kinase
MRQPESKRSESESFYQSFMDTRLKRRPPRKPKTPSTILQNYRRFKLFYDPALGEVELMKHKAKDRYVLRKSILSPSYEHRTEDEIEMILTKAYSHNRFMQKCYGILKSSSVLSELSCTYNNTTIDLFFEFHEKTLEGLIQSRIRVGTNGKTFAEEELVRIFKSIVLAGCHLQYIGEYHPQIDPKNIIRSNEGDYKLTNIYISDRFIDQNLGYHFLDKHIKELAQKKTTDEIERFKLYLNDRLDIDYVSHEKKAFYKDLIKGFIEGRVTVDDMQRHREHFYVRMIKENVLSLGFVILAAGTLTPFEKFYHQDKVVFREIVDDKLRTFHKRYSPELYDLLANRLLLYDRKPEIPMFDELLVFIFKLLGR